MANCRWFGANKTAIGGQTRLAEIEKVARRHGSRGLPAYFCLEAVALNVQEAWQAARRLDVGRAGACLARAAAALVSSRPALRSLISPKTWRIIGTRRTRELTTQR
jgi:hypothetical protein